MAFSKSPSNVFIPLTLLLVAILASPVAAFGAGDIPSDSGLENYNWKHGDITNVLLALPVSFYSKFAFTELEKKAVYFGNWLRDYSQVIDITLLQKTGNEAILLAIVSVLGFLEFGFATDEFDVTRQRLGCYRHEHHIDNPRGYDGAAAKKLDTRLRGPVREEEYAIDPKTGMKNYIASSGNGWDTAADYIASELRLSIECGRAGRRGDNSQRKESFIHLGAALHTLEDFSAHSNFTELCLIGMGETGVFPMVGDRCRISVPTSGKQVAPLVTGTFGMLDVLQSIVGEFDDKAAMQSRGALTNLTTKLETGDKGFTVLADALRQAIKILPFDGTSALGGLDKMTETANAIDSKNSAVSPDSLAKDQPSEIWQVIEPGFAVHDAVFKFVLEHEAILKPFSTIKEVISKAINAVVYKFLAIVLEPTIEELRKAILEGKKVVQEEDTKLRTYVDIFDDGSTGSDPSHSVIAKDHFSNILNRPAGLVATATTNWTTQQIVKCWDDDSRDATHEVNEILRILHHPFFADSSVFIQNVMYQVVQEWWNSNTDAQKQDVRSQLTKDGIQQNRNNSIKDASQFAGKPFGPAHFEGSKPKLLPRDVPVTEQLINALTDAAKTLENALDEIGEGVGNIGHAADEFTDDALKAVDEGFTTVTTAVGGFVDDVGTGVTSVATDVGNAVSDAANTFGQGVVSTATDVGHAVENAADTVGQGVSSAWQAVTGWF